MDEYSDDDGCQPFVENYDVGSIHESKKIREEDEKLLQSRERNKVHARNTRERKKIQMDAMLLRIESLQREKMDLSKQLLDTTVADILVCLSTNATGNTAVSETSSGTSSEDSSTSSHTSESKLKSLERIKLEISQDISDDNDDLKMDMELLSKDRSSCTIHDLENIRRERNRVHAKRTRIRKKRMMMELESNISKLEDEVRELRIRVQINNHKKSSMAMPAVISDLNDNELYNYNKALPGGSIESTSTVVSNATPPTAVSTAPVGVHGFPFGYPHSGPVPLPGYEQFAIPIPYNMVMYGNGGVFHHAPTGCSVLPSTPIAAADHLPPPHAYPMPYPIPQPAIEFMMPQANGYPYVNMDGSHGNHHSIQPHPFCQQWPGMMAAIGPGGPPPPVYGPPFAMVPIGPFGIVGAESANSNVRSGAVSPDTSSTVGPSLKKEEDIFFADF